MVDSTTIVHRELVDSESSTSSGHPAITGRKVTTESQISSTRPPNPRPSRRRTRRRTPRQPPTRSSTRANHDGQRQAPSSQLTLPGSPVSQADANSVVQPRRRMPEPPPLPTESYLSQADADSVVTAIRDLGPSQQPTVRQQFQAAGGGSFRRQPTFGRL